MALTPDEHAWAWKQLLEYIRDNDLENADNFRLAHVGDRREEDTYAKDKENGCCGMFDTEVFYRRTAKWIRIGCNYGH